MKVNEKEFVTFAGIVRRSCVPRSSCQYYVTLGLIPNSGKNERGWTLYDDTSVEAIKLTRELTTCGFSTSEIKEIYRKLTFDSVQQKFHKVPIEIFREWLKSKRIKLRH